MPPFELVEGELDDPRVIALVTHHAMDARAVLPQGKGHAFFIDGLSAPNIRFWSARRGDNIIGMGALKIHSAELGEVRSMRTIDKVRGQGLGHAILAHICAEARAMGLRQLGLETHPGPSFAPAIALYKKHGFVKCGPFGDYVLDPDSIFMFKTFD